MLQQHGATFAERDQLLDAERDLLARRGLWAGGAPVPVVSDALRTLAAPELSVDLRAGGPGPAVRAIAAARGSRAVIAVHRHEPGTGEDTVELGPVHPDSLGPAVLDLLGAPEVVGRGSIAVPAADLDHMFAEALPAEQGGARFLAGRLRAAGCAAQDADRVGAALADPSWVAQIGVTVGHGAGRRRVPRVVAVVETAQGRYLLVTRKTHDRSRWTTVLPAAAKVVRQSVDELVDESSPRQSAWLA